MIAVELQENEDEYELRRILGKGEGIFATRVFESREIVMIGIVERILPQNDSHASQMNKDTFVRYKGLISKVNHSCNPNCGIYINEMGGHDFIAIRDISVGEEITFDYAMRNYTIDFFPPPCRCGAPQCRVNITGWKDLPEEIKRNYEDFVAPYLLEL